MLKKVSDNFVNMIKYFGYKKFDIRDFNQFHDSIGVRISALVTMDEVEKLPIDHQILDNLEKVFDEIYDNELDESNIDYNYINERLKLIN